MSFEDLEISLESGKPAFLYTFARQGRTWRYTNVQEPVEYEGQTYLSIPAASSEISQSGAADADEYRVTLPADCALSQYLDALTTSFPITLLVQKVHLEFAADGATYLEPEDGSAISVWGGGLVSIRRPAQNIRELTLNTVGSTMKRAGLRLMWTRNCPHVLYGRGCNVDEAAYAVDVDDLFVVSGIEVSSATVGGYPDGWFSGGFIRWIFDDGLIEETGIETHEGTSLTLLGSTQGMEEGSAFVAYPGCNRTPTMCEDKFNNKLNYGGVEHLQGESPFSGKPIF